jgi:hypothetical protein
MTTNDEEVEGAIDAIMPHLVTQSPDVQRTVVMEVVARWLCEYPAFAREPLLVELLQTIRTMTPYMEMERWGPDGHPQKEPGPTSTEGSG